MDLGAFSVSLNVKDLAVSRAFYETLGFAQFAGDADHGYLIMKNGEHIIGLFQGMFEGNILTFNPGWDQSAQPIGPFEDVRDIAAKLSAAGIKMDKETEEGEGPASCMFRDPDGNVILLDQHTGQPT